MTSRLLRTETPKCERLKRRCGDHQNFFMPFLLCASHARRVHTLFFFCCHHSSTPLSDIYRRHWILEMCHVARLWQSRNAPITMRLQLFRELFTTTRIFVVATAGNVNARTALSLPVTLPPGTVVHVGVAVPQPALQYWTMKSRMPSPVAGEFTSGLPAVVQLFCNVTTLI